ncbi:MAG: hypothetical protein Q7S52_02390 [bacterium]|nr:hypothetical protein [bacterium]
MKACTTETCCKNPFLGDGRPIVSSSLENDFYKFSMGQFIFHRYPDTIVEFALNNRSKAIRFADEVDEGDLRHELDLARKVKSRKKEIAYLRGLRFVDHVVTYAPRRTAFPRVFADDYLEFMSTYRLPAYQLTKTADGQYDIRFRGRWIDVTFWECIALRILNTLRVRTLMRRFSEAEQASVVLGARENVRGLIAFMLEHPSIKMVEFGFRRAAAPLWQDEVDDELTRALFPKQLLGISNVFLARKYGVPPSGTMAHELFMVLQGIFHDEDNRAGTMESHQRVLWEWDDEWKGELSLALTDTYGSKYFFDNFPPELARRWRGFRQDSGDPVKFLDRAEDFLAKLNIPSLTKLNVPSDGLTEEIVLDVDVAAKGRFPIVNGWGTHVTFRVPRIPAASIVVKAVKAVDPKGIEYELVKLSDNPAKARGTPEVLERVRRLSGNSADTTYVETVY